MMMMMMMIIIIKASNKWLTNADLFAETEDFLTAIRDQVIVTRNYTRNIHWLSGKFPNVQNIPPLLRPSGARQVLLSGNELDELRLENRIAISCLVIVLFFFM